MFHFTSSPLRALRRSLLLGALLALGLPVSAQSTVIDIDCPDNVVESGCDFTLPDYTAEAVINASPGQNLDPAKIAAGSRHSLAVDDAGQLFAWGNNQYGKLGTGMVGISENTPTQIGSDTDWKTVSTGEETSYAIKNNGTLWAWGYNDEGQLGVGDFTDRAVPVQVGTDNDWIAVAGGRRHAIALKANGDVYTWGKNDNIALGYYPTSQQTTPGKVMSALVTNVVQVGASFNRCVVLRSDGVMVAWGDNVTEAGNNLAR